MSQPNLLSPAEILDLLTREYGPPPRRIRRDPTSELVLTVLSQNTNDVNRDRAFERLRERFPTWEMGRSTSPICQGGMHS